MQTKIEQIYKDYIDLKNHIEEENKNDGKLREEVFKEAEQYDTVEEQSSVFFDRLGFKNLLKIDLLEQEKKLYYFVQAYKDLIEIDKSILEEVQDYKEKTVFAILDGKREIVDKELYNYYKKQHQEYSVGLYEYNKIIQQNQEGV